MSAAHAIKHVDTRPQFAWPVHRDVFCSTTPLAWFDTWGEAADYAMLHDFFMGDPVRRAA